MTAPDPTAPLLRVVNPDATPEEIAAIVAVFSALGSATPAPAPARSRWAAPVDRMRPLHRPGPGAWRADALPR